MRLRYADNQRGFTLLELIVALGLSALLLVMIGTAALFVERYISRWSSSDRVAEELAFVSRELITATESARSVSLTGDTLAFQRTAGERRSYWLDDDRRLVRNGRPLTRAGIGIDTLVLTPTALPHETAADTATTADTGGGFYALCVVMSDGKGNVETLNTLIRNGYAYYQHRPSERLSIQ